MPATEVLKYIGPAFLVTVGFIDPGNWATNMAAGSQYGYALLWVVTLGTIMLVLLQHNAAHLGIVTGLCLSEASATFFRPWMSRILLVTAIGASVATAFAELLGTAIGLNMLFGLPLSLGAVLTAGLASTMLLTNTYRRLEQWILGFVSLVGLAFLVELSLVHIAWGTAAQASLTPSVPAGAQLIILGVLGAVVMPHNIYLHSEIIQSRHWNLRGEEVIGAKLRYEFIDTLAAMLVGWAINAAMILVGAAVFFKHGVVITELPQAHDALQPLLGEAAATIFALALIFAGYASSMTAGMAGASMLAGMSKKPMELSEKRSRTGALITLLAPLPAIFLLQDPFRGLVGSQVLLSLQLPFTVLPLVILTSSRRVMGKFANAGWERILLWAVVAAVVSLNLLLVAQLSVTG
jgi:manganese transport protein